jgi:hypothetical protein
MSTSSVSTQLKPVTPTEIFLQLAGGTFDAIRANNQGMSYTPLQFGGLIGQLVVGNNANVMQLTSFSIK